MREQAHIALLPGDGIGPEVTAVARRVSEAAGFDARWQEHPVGWHEWCRNGRPLPEKTLEGCRDADAVLLGAVTSKPEAQAQKELDPRLQDQRLRYVSPVLQLRRALGLHLNLRPAVGNGMDVTVFRENSEGLYAGHEARPIPASLGEIFPGLPTGDDAAVSLRLVTRQAIERLSRQAFAHAQAHGKDRVALVEKPNVLRATGGLVRETFHQVAKDHPGVTVEEVNIDAACALLVRDPQRFQVIVATNLFGDIISDLAAELAGGLSLAASANLGETHALFEPVHGSAPDIAGQGLANPIGAVRSAALMAHHVGQLEPAQRMEHAVDAVLADPALRSVDLGGRATTTEIEQGLLAALETSVISARSRS